MQAVIRDPRFRKWMPVGIGAALLLTALALLLPRPGGLEAGSRTGRATEAKAATAAQENRTASPAPKAKAETSKSEDEFFTDYEPGRAIPAAEASAKTPSAEDALAVLAGDDPAQQAVTILALRSRPTPEIVEAALKLFRTTGDDRTRALLLFLLSGTRTAVENSERDALLAAGAVPFLKGVAFRPADGATAPALLALSDLGTDEAAHVLTAVAQDPQDPVRGGQGLAALVMRPDAHAVAALQSLATDAGSHSTHLRAVGALLEIVLRRTPAEAGVEAPECVSEARRFLAIHGAEIARGAALASRLPDVQARAESILKALESLH